MVRLITLLLALVTTVPISLKLSNTVAMAPAAIRVLVRVERHADNRAVCLGYEPTGSEGNPRQSCWEIQGDSAPVTTQVTFTDIQGGEYEMQASVCRGYWQPSTNECRQWLGAVPQRFQVMGRHTKRKR